MYARVEYSGINAIYLARVLYRVFLPVYKREGELCIKLMTYMI